MVALMAVQVVALVDQEVVADQEVADQEVAADQEVEDQEVVADMALAGIDQDTMVADIVVVLIEVGGAGATRIMSGAIRLGATRPGATRHGTIRYGSATVPLDDATNTATAYLEYSFPRICASNDRSGTAKFGLGSNAIGL